MGLQPTHEAKQGNRARDGVRWEAVHGLVRTRWQPGGGAETGGHGTRATSIVRGRVHRPHGGVLSVFEEAGREEGWCIHIGTS